MGGAGGLGIGRRLGRARGGRWRMFGWMARWKRRWKKGKSDVSDQIVFDFHAGAGGVSGAGGGGGDGSDAARVRSDEYAAFGRTGGAVPARGGTAERRRGAPGAGDCRRG